VTGRNPEHAFDRLSAAQRAASSDAAPANVSESAPPLARYGWWIRQAVPRRLPSIPGDTLRPHGRRRARRSRRGRPEWAHALRTGFMPD